MVDGFSSIDPSQARGPQVSAGTYSRLYGRKKSKRTKYKSVSIKGNTVFINGKGFSVAPSLQASFIQKQTGGSGSSARAAIQMATNIEVNRKQEEARKQEEVRKQTELAKLSKLKTDIARSQMSREDKIKAIEQVQQQKKSVEFESGLKTGEIQGFSGFGLSPSQFAKREFLLKTKMFKESSSKDNIFRNLDPLTTSYFVDKSPSVSDKNNFVTFLKSEQFNTARVLLPGKILSIGNQLVKNINNYVKQIKADPSKAAFLSVKLINNKNALINNLKNFFGPKINFTTRNATLLALYLTSTGVGLLTSTGEALLDNNGEGSFIKGFQKVSVSRKFQSEEVRKEQEKKEEKWNAIMKKMVAGGKMNQTDINNFREIAKITPEKLIDKDIAKFAQITGGVIGTVVVPIPGAIIWALGDTMESVRRSAGDGGKISKAEFGKIVFDSATKGALFGAGAKILGIGGNLISKRVLLGTALRSAESSAIRAALNHGGILIKFVGRSGKNFISTYFMKDMLGNVFDVTADVKAGRLNNALRKATETVSAVGGYVGGSSIGKATTKGALFASGKLKATAPEFAQKKIPLDVMAKQLLSEGKIILTRRGVYETGKGLSPRKDAWLDSRVKNPTKSVFWRFDKTLSKKDEAISPLPLFTKSKAGYLKMFSANWKKNSGMSLLKRYLKTTAETPLVEDVLIRRIVNLKNIKDLALRKQIIKEYATKGKLSKATQDKVLKNNFPISDKNREFGFHDENEFVTRTGFKFKGRKDISWTYDPSLSEYVPVVQNLKHAGRIKNFLSILNRKRIITRTDAKFIADNYAIKKKFGASSILPQQHSYKHMKQVQDNIIKIMNKYPEFNSYWKRKYGSIAKAKEAMKQAMWHDIGKGESASKAFGTPHGEKVWNVWKAKLLPKGIKLTKPVALAIKKHETLDPRKLWYKVQNKAKLVSPEEKIVATADRLDLNRVGIKIDLARLPLKDAIKRLGIKVRYFEYPSKFNRIITKIKLDKGVTKDDLKKLLAYTKTKVKKIVLKKPKKRPTKRPSKRLKKRHLRRPPKRPPKRPSKRPAKRPTKRPAKRPPMRPTGRLPKRPPKRPSKRPPKRPTKRPPKRPPKRPARRPPKRPPRKPPAILGLPKRFTKKTLSKAVPVYFVKEKVRGKLKNLTPRPLVLSEAKDFLTYRLDNNLSRTGFFVPIGKAKTIVKVPPRMKNYFVKNKRKLRPYKVRMGKKRQIFHGYIEKKKFVGDTKSELRQLTASRKKRKITKRKPIRKPKTKKLKKKRPLQKTSQKKKKPKKRKRIVKRKPSKKIPKKKKIAKRKQSKKKPKKRKTVKRK